MKRNNTKFKAGRGSLMLEKILNKENEDHSNLISDTENADLKLRSSSDIKKGLASPRYIQAQKDKPPVLLTNINEVEQFTGTLPFHNLTDLTENDFGPSLVPVDFSSAQIEQDNMIALSELTDLENIGDGFVSNLTELLENALSPSVVPVNCSTECEQDMYPIIKINEINNIGDGYISSSSDVIEDTPPRYTQIQKKITVPPAIINDDLEQVTSTIPSPCSSNRDENHITIPEDDLQLTDDSVADPDWENSDILNDKISDTEDNELETKAPKKIKTKRWHKKNEDTYDRNKQKVCKSQCLPYKNYKKKLLPAKAPKPGGCQCKLNCPLNFSEEERKKICQTYWGLRDYCRQKDFILANISVNPPQRCYVKAVRKRTISRSYFFSNDEGKIKVCEKFFKSTLCISNGPINKAFSKVGSSGLFEGEDQRGKHVAHNKTKQDDIDFIKQHIESFPTMESHYCRKTSSKLYLDGALSISKMYELYTEECKKASRTSVTINVYRNIFGTEYNLDFHKPKKDQCLTCHKYNTIKNTNGPDLESWKQKYDLHISLKEQSREAKELDKIRANEDESFNSITLDLQKVLHIPNGTVSILYYLRKLNVYNATIYEARTPNDGFCYLWSELDGKKGSDEVGTALYLWIKRLPPTVKEISIFTDTCGGQNRNQFLLSLQLYLVQTTHLEVIEHKYLESGHTHMEVDSMHSAIENQLRLMPMYSMIDFCNVIRLARSNRKNKKNKTLKKPYEPIVMNHTDILNLKDLRDNLMQNRSIDVNGEKLRWLKVKSFRLEKKRPNVVLYRYDFKSEYKEFHVIKSNTSQSMAPLKKLRKRKLDNSIQGFNYNTYILKKAYNENLPITQAKKKDLLKMCNEKIIPAELHHWYQNLPAKESRDYVPEEMSSNSEDED